MKTSDFDFSLPPELIASIPVPERDGSRLLVLDRTSKTLGHNRFCDLLKHLRAGDLLVLNDSRVIPARLHGFKEGSGGKVEILLIEEIEALDWWVLLRPGKRVRPGTRLRFSGPNAGAGEGLFAEVREKNAEGHCRLRFDPVPNFFSVLRQIGEIPLPPYIESATQSRDYDDRSRYQTVFAKSDGSVAAPTAGLHFTDNLLRQIQEAGVEIHFLTLHVGAGTFLPVKESSLEDHRMHSERFIVSEQTAEAVNRAKREGRRVIAVGTTSTRVLESLALASSGVVLPGEGTTDIFIRPPFRFQIVDALITNFHLPQSTLLMLVSAFADSGGISGIERMKRAYLEAIESKYRFYSYGDAMILL